MMHYLMAILKQESATELCREIAEYKLNEVNFVPNSHLHFTILYFSLDTLESTKCVSDLKAKVDSLILPDLKVDEIRIGAKQLSLVIKKDEQLERIHSFLACDMPYFVNIFNQKFSEWLPHIIISDKISKKNEVDKSVKSDNCQHQIIKSAIKFERILITRKENDRFHSIYDRKLQIHNTRKK